MNDRKGEKSQMKTNIFFPYFFLLAVYSFTFMEKLHGISCFLSRQSKDSFFFFIEPFFIAEVSIASFPFIKRSKVGAQVSFLFNTIRHFLDWFWLWLSGYYLWLWLSHCTDCYFPFFLCLFVCQPSLIRFTFLCLLSLPDQWKRNQR